MIPLIAPAPIARQPWRVIVPLFALVCLGTAVLYSAAGGSFRPWALSHFVRFFVFLGMALALSHVRRDWRRAARRGGRVSSPGVAGSATG